MQVPRYACILCAYGGSCSKHAQQLSPYAVVVFCTVVDWANNIAVASTFAK